MLTKRGMHAYYLQERDSNFLDNYIKNVFRNQVKFSRYYKEYRTLKKKYLKISYSLSKQSLKLNSSAQILTALRRAYEIDNCYNLTGQYISYLLSERADQDMRDFAQNKLGSDEARVDFLGIVLSPEQSSLIDKSKPDSEIIKREYALFRFSICWYSMPQ